MRVLILLNVKRIIKGGGFNELTIMLVDSLTTFRDYQMTQKHAQFMMGIHHMTHHNFLVIQTLFSTCED
jgi:archaellum biogenesis ATPase FlaH